ncbi:hypothetical protein TWF481_003880 [Arthrobotrys musiformis]|uniref:Uncharacterized protein n=1 Tax=Arthrobotrys musiformis TaxID=47236 RepID=A0AAV9WJY2_9PEZI
MSASKPQLDLASLIVLNPLPTAIIEVPGAAQCGQGGCSLYGGLQTLESCGDWLGFSNYCCFGIGGIESGPGPTVGYFYCSDVPGISGDIKSFGYDPIVVATATDCPDGTAPLWTDPTLAEIYCCRFEEYGVLVLQRIDYVTGSLVQDGVRCFDPKIVDLKTFKPAGVEGPTSAIPTRPTGVPDLSSTVRTSTVEGSEESTSIATRSSSSSGGRTTAAETTAAETTAETTAVETTARTGSSPEPSEGSSTSEDLGSSAATAASGTQSATGSPTPNSASRGGISKFSSFVFGTMVLSIFIGVQL